MNETPSPLMDKIYGSIDKKVALINEQKGKYLVRALMAALFLTLGTAVAVVIGEKGEHILPGTGKILYAFHFSWSLVMILYLNAELGTSNMMYMTVGVYDKKVKVPTAVKVLFWCVLMNLIGGIVFGYFMSLTAPFHDVASDNFLLTAVSGKLEKTSLEIFVEAIFANIVVNIAVLVSMRMKDDAGKVLGIVFLIFIFAFLGFEHVIANFASFSLAFFASHGTLEAMTVGNTLRNLILAFLGNYIGGGLVMGLGYAWLNRTGTKYVD